jgi:hypothetical protein
MASYIERNGKAIFEDDMATIIRDMGISTAVVSVTAVLPM